MTFGVFVSEAAVGGDCACGAPQSSATRPSSFSSELYVRWKMVAPSTAHANDAQRKMKTIAMMRFTMSVKAPCGRLHFRQDSSGDGPVIKAPRVAPAQESAPRDGAVVCHDGRACTDARSFSSRTVVSRRTGGGGTRP